MITILEQDYKNWMAIGLAEFHQEFMLGPSDIYCPIIHNIGTPGNDPVTVTGTEDIPNVRNNAVRHIALWCSNVEELQMLCGYTPPPVPQTTTTKTTIYTAWRYLPEEQTEVTLPENTVDGAPPVGWSITKPATVPEGYTLWSTTGIPNILGDTSWSSPQVSAEGWAKPGTTLIDGNSIYTGDAYVDTLQIRGNAVTLTEYATTGATPIALPTADIGDLMTIVYTPGTFPLEYGVTAVVTIAIRVGTTVPGTNYAPFFQWEFFIDAGYSTISLPLSFTNIAESGTGAGDHITLNGKIYLPLDTTGCTIKLRGRSVNGEGTIVANALIMGVKR